MALHTGEGHLAGDDYGGFDVNKAARIAWKLMVTGERYQPRSASAPIAKAA